MANYNFISHFVLHIQLLSTKGKQFNEDVMEKYSEVDPGQEVRIIDQEHLEKPFQVKFVAGKVYNDLNGAESLWDAILIKPVLVISG